MKLSFFTFGYFGLCMGFPQVIHNVNIILLIILLIKIFNIARAKHIIFNNSIIKINLNKLNRENNVV